MYKYYNNQSIFELIEKSSIPLIYDITAVSTVFNGVVNVASIGFY